jgi:hypothetical protein
MDAITIFNTEDIGRFLVESELQRTAFHRPTFNSAVVGHTAFIDEAISVCAEASIVFCYLQRPLQLQASSRTVLVLGQDEVLSADFLISTEGDSAGIELSHRAPPAIQKPPGHSYRIVASWLLAAKFIAPLQLGQGGY